MHLSALHDAVRALMHGDHIPKPAGTVTAMTAAERAAVRNLRRRLRAAGGDLSRVLPMAGSAEWYSPPGPSGGAVQSASGE